jgi:hypothetical protein
MSLVPKAPIAKSNPNSAEIKRTRMKCWLFTLLTFNFVFLISACGLDIEDPTPPSPPIWVQKSLPDEWPERGIDAHELGGINIEWVSNTDEEILAYHIFRATKYEASDSVGDYRFLDRVKMVSSDIMEYRDSESVQRTRYYYKIKAEDTSNNLSKYSDSLSYMLLPPVTLDLMRPNGAFEVLSQDQLLSWGYSYQIEMEDYTLTIITDGNDFVWREVFPPSSYVSWKESWQIPEAITLNINGVYKWRIDIGADYHEDKELTGAESAWASFRF